MSCTDRLIRRIAPLNAIVALATLEAPTSNPILTQPGRCELRRASRLLSRCPGDPT